GIRRHLPISRRALRRAAAQRATGRARLRGLSQRAPFRRGDADLSASSHAALRPFRAPERRLPQAVADYGRWTLGRLAGLESLMGGADHVAAGRFTAADISVGYALMLLKITGLFDQAPASLQAYYGRLRERPAFKRAKSAQKVAASEKGVAPPGPPERAGAP